MKYASVDIGTNTMRLLIAEDAGGGRIRPLVYERAITRLGGGYSEETGIAPASALRAFAAIEKFKETISAHDVGFVRAVATSVVRRAKNRDWFTGEIKRKTGMEVDIISGGDEARLSLEGVLSVLEPKGGTILVIDIGGGSTEFIASKGGVIKGAWSMDMGVVHLAETFLLNDPPRRGELSGMEAAIEGVIKGLIGLMAESGVDRRLYSDAKGASFVGTAGTITTLAALDQDLEEYDRARINNYILKKERIIHFYNRLSSITIKERERILSLERGREDLIIPGAAITLKAMEAFGFGEMRVSDAGLLEGVIIDAFPGATPAGAGRMEV